MDRSFRVTAAALLFTALAACTATTAPPERDADATALPEDGVAPLMPRLCARPGADAVRDIFCREPR